MKIDFPMPTGVVLLNMGGPERLADVEPFLYNLFSDRKIIRLGPRLLQRPLAWWIARKRAPKSCRSYAAIGGGSPLTRITRGQGERLGALLAAHGSFFVVIAMRYWHPLTEEAVSELVQNNISRLVVLPLYPHYSIATTGSSLSRLHEVINSKGHAFDIAEIKAWPTESHYIASLGRAIEEGCKNFSGRTPTVLYSAHSLPAKFVEEGDPYVEHINATIRAVEERTKIFGRLAFQSRSGPVRWLTPSTPDMLQLLAQEGVKDILMVPLSFVSDHVETLYEIDILYREMAEKLGMQLARTESLNLKEDFIAGLSALVLDAARTKGWISMGQ